jgi:hypothetical protein
MKMCTQKQGVFSYSWIVRESLASPKLALQPPRPSLTLGLSRLNATLDGHTEGEHKAKGS